MTEAAMTDTLARVEFGIKYPFLHFSDPIIIFNKIMK